MSKLKNYYKKHRNLSKLFLLLLITFSLVVGYLGYNTYQIHADKKRFADASTLVDKIYADIVRELGQPEDSKRTNSCSRPYREFTGYTKPVCRAGVSIIYSVENRVSANEFLVNIQKIVALNREMIISGLLSSSIQDSVAANTEYHAASDIYLFKDLKCTVNYVYDTPSETYLKTTTTPNKLLQISLGCSGESQSPVYPTVQ